jgi:hypothetical protein
MKFTLSYSDRDDISDTLLGHRVTNVKGDTITLDDGTSLKIIPNEGGCICGAGDYSLTSLNRVDNIITHVEFNEVNTDKYDEWSYRIFVLAGDEKINLLQVDGDDGNGYYGTGYQILVTRNI